MERTHRNGSLADVTSSLDLHMAATAVASTVRSLILGALLSRRSASSVLVSDLSYPLKMISKLSCMDTDEDCSATGTSLPFLPPEVLASLFRYFNTNDLNTFCQLSNTTRRIAMELTTDLYLGAPRSSGHFARLLGTFRKARSLTIDMTGLLSPSALSCIAGLSHLRELYIGDISGLPCPQALFDNFSALRKLTHLEIGFGTPIAFLEPQFPPARIQSQCHHKNCSLNLPHLIHGPEVWGPYSVPTDLPSFDMSPLFHLIHLEHLVLRNAPKTWNPCQVKVFPFLKHLKTLDISYRALPANLDFLAHLQALKKLRLTCYTDNTTEIRYQLPKMAELEELSLPQWCVAPRCLLKQTKLRLLKFTPFGWMKVHISALAKMPNIKHLEARLSWVPNAASLSRAFQHLHSLSLLELDVSRLHCLEGLKDLRILVLDTLMKDGRIATARDLNDVPALLQAMPGLIGFSLINVEHLSAPIARSILKSKVNILELSGCSTCVQDFIDLANREFKFNYLTNFTAHIGDTLYTWNTGDSNFTISRTSRRGVDFLPENLF